MRNAFKVFALAAGIAVTAISCNKEETVQGPITFTIRAGVPETKTAITNNGDGTYSPSWSANDAIGVFFTNVVDTPVEFDNDDAGTTAFFEPKEEIAVSGNQTLYSFYPLGAFQEVKDGTSIRINVKAVQTPDALGTFDKSSDILVARPYAGNITQINEDGGIIDMAFARILSVVKITPSESATAIDNEYVKSIKIEYNGSGEDAPLAGRVVLDLNSGDLGDWTIKTYSASANYGESVFALNGTNAAYLLVNPITIASGKKVTFTVKTDKHDASREFTLGEDLVFPAGNIATIALNITNDWTIEDNTLDPNIIFKTPFYADISSNTTYDAGTHGDLGVVGTSKSSISYSFSGTAQLRNNSNKISADDASFYWCTSSTGLTIGGINAGTNQYFNLGFDRKVPSGTATLAISISEDGTNWFPITSSETVSISGTSASTSSFNFSIPSGDRDNIRLKFDNSGNGIVIDNLTLTRLDAAGDSNKAVSLEVVAVDPSLVVEPSPVNILAGNTQQLSVTGTNGTIHYSSNNSSVATVSSTGLVTGVAEGSTTISITSDATANYNAGATSVTVNVSAALSFDTVAITESWSADLKTDADNNAKFKNDGKGVWTTNATYGRVAANNATSSSLYSPKFDMSGVTAGTITFAHTGNVTGTDYQDLGKAYYTLDNGTSWTQISLTNPSSYWSWQTATISSTIYAGETIQFRWDFQGNASKTWQVKDFVITVPVSSAVTFTSPVDGGSFTVSVGGNAISTGTSVLQGTSVSLAASAGDGYSFSSWSVYKTGDQSTTVPVSNNSFTMPAYPVTISATFTSTGGGAPSAGTVLWTDTFGTTDGGTTTTFGDQAELSVYTTTTVDPAHTGYSGRSGYGDNTDVTLTASNDQVRVTKSSGTNCTGSHLWFNKSQNAAVTTSAIRLYGATSLVLTYDQGTSGSSITASYSKDGGSSWTDFDASGPGADITREFTVPSNTESVILKFSHSSSNAKNTRFDNPKLAVGN